MYLENVQKLFKDIQSIPTMADYAEAVIEDGMENDLANLISIVQCYSGELHDGDINGSCRWDLSQCETEKERQQMIEDDKAMTRIKRQLDYELSSTYIMICTKCRQGAYYKRKPRYITNDTNPNKVDNYYCPECYKATGEKTLAFYTTEAFLANEHPEALRYLKQRR